MKILITGDKGFIGNQISLFFRSHNIDFTGVDKGDIIPDEPFDMVLHFGARTLIRNSLEHPFEYFMDNEVFTMEILERCRKNDAVIVFPTSGSVSLPTNPYSLTKKNGEEWVKMYSRLYGVKSHVLKLFNIYGESSRKGAVYLMCKAAVYNEPATVFGDGTHRRDFVYVGDLVNFVHQIVEGKVKPGDHEIGTGIGTSVNELISKVERLSNNKIRPVYKPYVLEEAEDLHALHSALNKFTKLEYGIKIVLENMYKEKGKDAN